MTEATEPWQLAEDIPIPKHVNAPYKPTPKAPKLTPAEERKFREMQVEGGAAPPCRDQYSAPIAQDEEWFRHHHWERKRKLVTAALYAVGTHPRAMENFLNCGAEATIEYCKDEGKYRVRASYCHNRHCEPCMRAKAQLLSRNLQQKIKDTPGVTFRFVTLTLRHSPDLALKPQIEKLYESWRTLRTTKMWRASQRGGCAMLEIKWTATGGWHPHLHIITQGEYMPAQQLSNEWHRITGDSHITDIRKLNKVKDAAYYVTKYVTKGCNANVWDNPQAAAEYIKALKGVRACGTFGSWRGFRLTQRPATKGEWKTVALLKDVARKARQGDIVAITLLTHLEETCMYNPHRPRRRQPKNE